MKKIEYIKFVDDIPFLDIKKGNTFRVYYDKSCTRFIKVDDLIINVDRRKESGCMELISKDDK